MSGKLSGLLPALVLIAAACGGAESSPEERQEARREARTDSVEQAEAMYDSTAYDTITWASDNAMYERGGVVWSFSCQRCHGPDGKGQGEWTEKYGFTVPDITVADWPLAGDVPAIRKAIFVGHSSEMPNWGLKGLKPRDVDAVAHYIDGLLR
jgi:mono/diheme cytochrome c family protein